MRTHPSTHVLEGYAALTATLVVCTVLTVLAFQAGTGTYLARLSALEAEYAEVSRLRAYSCVQVALFELAADSTYRPKNAGDTVNLSPNSRCTIVSIEGNDMLTLITQGEESGFSTTLEVILDESPTQTPPFILISFRKI